MIAGKEVATSECIKPRKFLSDYKLVSAFHFTSAALINEGFFLVGRYAQHNLSQ